MGGEAKKVYGYTAPGLLANQGSSAASDYQAQYDALGGGPRPDLVARQSRLGTDGLLQDVYKLQGPEAWQKAALAQSGVEEQGLRDTGAEQAAGAAANARSSLATRGGLTGGAGERLAKTELRGSLAAGQEAARQGVQSRADINTQAANKTTQTQQYNIQQALDEKNAQDQYNLSKYQADMNEWAASKQAQATMAAGRGKGQRGGIVGGAASTLGK